MCAWQNHIYVGTSNGYLQRYSLKVPGKGAPPQAQMQVVRSLGRKPVETLVLMSDLDHLIALCDSQLIVVEYNSLLPCGNVKNSRGTTLFCADEELASPGTSEPPPPVLPLTPGAPAPPPPKLQRFMHQRLCVLNRRRIVIYEHQRDGNYEEIKELVAPEAPLALFFHGDVLLFGFRSAAPAGCSK